MRVVVRFLLGGGLGVAAYYAVLIGLTEVAGVWYLGSSVAAWLANWSLNFLVQKHWTFHNRERAEMRTQLVRYFAMAGGFLLAGTGLLYLLVDGFGMHYLTAQIALSAAGTVVSFFLTRRIFSR